MTPRKLRRLFRLYFPYLGAGIRLVELRDDWRYAKVELRLRWFNPNYFGTHFGGSLYAMTDPFWAMLVLQNLGPDYVVWDKAASIEFEAAVKEPVTAEFLLDPAVVEELRAAAEGGQKVLRWFDVEVKTAAGKVVARVRKQVYVRRRRPGPEPGGRPG